MQIKNRKLFFSWTLSLVIGIMTSQPSSATQENQIKTNPIDRITSLYTAGRLNEALAQVNALLQLQPANGLLHYYKGNILAKAGHVQDAKTEYQEALACQPDAAIANYCTKALGTIDAPANNAITAIRTQTLSREQRLQQEAYATANTIRQQAITQANATNQQTQSTTASMQRAGYYDQNRNWVPQYSPQDIQRVQQEGQDRAQNILQEGDLRSQAVVQEARQRATSMEESEQTLESQIGRGKKDNLHLDVNGTNLYVRHYLPETVKEQPLKAKQDAGRFENPLSAQRQELSIEPTAAKTSAQHGVKATVHGQVVNQKQPGAQN